MQIKKYPQIKNQQGLALLVLVIVIALAFITYSVSELSITNVRVEQIKNTQIALKKAKRALIAYAINYPKDHSRGPGYLLCPDTDNDGNGEGGCNGPSTVGRLPWKTLNIGDLRDSSNERLWYAVSENYDYTASPDPDDIGPEIKIINTGTRGNITVRDSNDIIIYDGTKMDAVVAVVIAPGEVLTRADGTVQDRSDVNNAINYLDINGSGGEDNTDFEQGTLGDTNNNGFIQGDIFDASGNIIVNDKIEVITYRDLMGPIHKRVSQEISNLINDYFIACGAYPEAAAFNPAGLSFSSPGLIPPGELRKGHIPLTSARPINWGSACTPAGATLENIAPVPAAWLETEEWHKESYYEFAYINPDISSPPFAPSSAGTACTAGVNCLSVDTVNNVNALIILSGRALEQDLTLVPPLSIQIRASVNMQDYFEAENNNGDLIFQSVPYASKIPEDFIRIISP
jgi:hypothetical protein